MDDLLKPEVNRNVSYLFMSSGACILISFQNIGTNKMRYTDKREVTECQNPR